MLSVARRQAPDLSANSAARDPTGWRRSMLILFHGAAVTTFGFALGYQSVSSDAAQLHAMASEAVRPFGKWRFLTYNCLIMQFVSYSLCFASNFMPRLKKQRDYMLTIFAVPQAIMVFGCFWGVWAIMGRKYIFPEPFSRYYPPWLNHVTHTVIVPVNLIELVSNRHHFWPDRQALTPQLIYTFAYIGYTFLIRYCTGKWTYPFLGVLHPVAVGCFCSLMCVTNCVVYKLCRKFHDYIHGIKSTKSTKPNKKSK